MQNVGLADINFREIVDYGGQPEVHNRYPRPLACRGYCIDCEQSGVLREAGGELSLMSHGCDSTDFQAVLGPMNVAGSGVTMPVLFLLENPGADDRYRNGTEVAFRGSRKKPPVNHYYWTPSARPWPHQVADFIYDPHFYGPYFAYLMQRHRLLDVYITNVAKCKWTRAASGKAGGGGASLVARHCSERFLEREFEIFRPRLVVCFGGNAERGFREFSRRFGLDAVSITLIHPAFIKNRSQTDPQRRSKEQLFAENDHRIVEALTRLA